MIAELYDALKEAHVSEKARAAATAMAEYERRLTNIETDLKGITRELHLHRWILGYLVAATTAILLRVFS